MPPKRWPIGSVFGPVSAVAVAPDGTWLATASGDGDKTARTWDTATWRHRATHTGHRIGVEAVAIAPDGTWLATARSDKTVRLWDAGTGSICAVMWVDSPLGDCAWSPSGRLLAAAGSAGLYLFAFNY